MSALGPARLALVTAVYPAVLPYLSAWYRSVLEQDDRAFDLWIASDGLSPAAVAGAVGEEPVARWVAAAPGDTPAQVRQRVLELAVQRYDAVVLVDSDDLLHPSRVGEARRRLASCDLSACALRLVDERGGDLGGVLGLASDEDPDHLLPRRNVFGLSNTAYRCDLLRRCLPLPAEALAADWFLATRAWLARARLDFDTAARMDYRQHGANATAVRPPFDAARVRRDTAVVAAHLASVAASPGERPDAARLAAVEAFAADVAAFSRRVADDRQRLATYVARLADLRGPLAWWAHVAHPALRDLWRDAA